MTLYLTCDERLVDSMNIIATEELKALEKQRREALLERENGEEEVEE